ncbi:methylmalonyl-CoA mutase subunit beta [Flavobacterium sp.]|uniref:methylmalonyl-CoA mutase subunit beta n=1 Tax=Flavobacterium sp. TaxID=239 RepID=UPI0026311E9E|nr:methylmalonyl-CoA mutase subunit beta [Flavobacterium sp.]MDD3004421.1 methylmalonyl-CoA mutase subunit beta [Flavobacterium sp.]
MAEKLFKDFEHVSSKQWKQQIQYDLKGADYNDALVWESLEGIKIKPFYHADEQPEVTYSSTKKEAFQICQNIFVFDVEKSVRRSLETLQRGAESLRFTISDKSIDIHHLLEKLPLEKTTIYFNLEFLDVEFVQKLNTIAQNKNAHFLVQLDPIGQLTKDGNWFSDLKNDFDLLNQIKSTCTSLSFLSIDGSLYQNAGATMVQQIAYIAAHTTEYLNRISDLSGTFVVQVAVGSHYFFEIAKLRALRLVIESIIPEFNPNIKIHILTTPSKRNKTLYDYNVNMLRTTTECMSAILGESDAVCNLPYDVLYHKENEFGDRISRNQLLILKNESYFDKVNNPADGAYFIENITQQMAEKALILFKEIELADGFITQLIGGNIQKKIQESASKEQDLFDSGKEILLGTNKYPNKDDRMSHDLELFPFVKTKPRKTLITPIIEKRLAEKIEKERLDTEKSSSHEA